MPVILVATANEAAGARHLRSLAFELQDIVAALEEAKRGGICEIVTLADATPEQVMGVFQHDAYRDRIAVLHFAGHAGPEGLLFETSDGSTAVADASGLAAFLGCQRGLQLVVLNACATQSHVDALRDAGVGAIVATSKTVEDAIAHQFAVLLYQGLGSGAGIKRAYDEAAAGVRFKHGATARGSTAESMHASAAAVVEESAPARGIQRKDALTTDDGRWPWDLYFRRGAEEIVGPWALPEAAGNPLFGLPKLPETDKPLAEPFRHLRPFLRQHAELFFGRGKDIRELYDKVTSAASEPVILLYGATGVGKSSLLDAGLLPRLTGTYEVRYAPRDRTLKLLGTLMTTVGGDATGELDAARVADAWRAQEQRSGSPLFVVIDQIEEAYTTEDAGRAAVGEAARELDAFAKALGQLFANDTTRPRGRLVLAFRKEWLSEVKGALETHRVPRTEHRLEQLTRNGVLEAITGPTRIPARRMPTRLEIEPGLDVLIADDLLANRASHVAPLLQILLATMWAEAPRKVDVVRFDAALYSAVQAKAKQLDEFLTKQLDALRSRNAPWVDSGLALEFLRFYTTPKGTSDEHTADEEKQRYPNADTPSPGLRAMFAQLFLLVERVDDAGAPLPDRPARLAHDTLAPIVRERFDRSDLPGPRAKRILDGRSAEWKDGKPGTSLDEADLRLVEEGEIGMRVWNDEEKALVAASRVARDRARRRRAWAIRGAVAAVTVIIGFGVGSWMLYQQSQQRLAESTSRDWSVRALSADAPMRDVALLYAIGAYEQSPTFEARRALFTQLARDPSLVRVVSTSANGMVFGRDSEHLLLAEADALYSLDVATGVETQVGKIPRDVNLGTLTIDPSRTAYAAASTDSVSGVLTIQVWEVGSGQKLGELRIAPPNKPKPTARPLKLDTLGNLSVGTLDGLAPPEIRWQLGPRMADGRRLVAASSGNDVVLWDLNSGLELHRLKGHTGAPAGAFFSADGSVLVTTGEDARLIAWDVATGKSIRTVRTASFGGPIVAISHDNSTVAVGLSSTVDTVALYSLRNTRPPRYGAGVGSHLVAFTAGDSALVAASLDGDIRVFEQPLDERRSLDSSSAVATLHQGDTPQSLGVAPAGRRIALMSGEGTVYVWDLADRALVRSYALPIDTLHQVERLTMDGKLAEVGTTDGFNLWDITVAPPVRRMSYDRWAMRHLPPSRQIRVGGAGRLLAVRSPGNRAGWRYVLQGTSDSVDHVVNTAGDDGSLLVLDPVRPRVAYGLPKTRGAVVVDLASGAADTLDPGSDPAAQVDTSDGAAVEFSPRGDLLMTQPTQMSLLVWDLATKRVRDSLTGIAAYVGMLVSEDGSTISATDGSMVQFWKRGAHEPTSRFRWKTGAPPTSFALSPDGQLFAYDNDGKVTLGDVARGDMLGEIETGQGTAVGLAFVDGGRALVAVNAEGRITRIPTDPDAWVVRACAVVSSRGATERFTVHAPAGSRPPTLCRPGTRGAR